MLSLLVASVLTAAPAMPAPPEVLQELRGIESANLRGKADDLRIKYQDQARNRPADVLLRIYIAWTVLPSDDAWNQLKAIAALNPENPWVHLGMGRTYTAWKMRDQAKAEYRMILKEDSKFSAAIAGLAELALIEGDLKGAESQYRASLGLLEDPRARGGLGLTLLQAGKTAEAKVELDRAMKAWPDQPAVLAALLKIQRDAKDAKAAADTAMRLAELQPKDPEVRKILADLRFDEGNKAEAAKEYERWLRVAAPTAEVLGRLETLYRELKDADGEERTLQVHASFEKTNPAPSLRLAELAEAKGNKEVAEGHLLEAIDRDPKAAGPHLQLARMRARRDALFEALNEYRIASALEGDAATAAKAEREELEKKIKLPAKPPKGSVDAIYNAVAKGLNDFYLQRKREKPKLAGELKVRVRVKASGEVESVDVLNDTVGDSLLAAHVYFALNDAVYQKQKREPVFEFELGSVKKAK
jgi:Tfp pilus assembly protein PilF